MSRVAERSHTPVLPRTTRRRRALILAASAAVVLSACGGGGESASGEGDENLYDPRNSPLAQLMGWGGDMAEQRARELEVQQELAQCMQDEGWEYEPVDWQAQMGDMSAEWELQMTDPEAYGEKYGYGVVRGFESQGEMSGQQFEDPNQDYMMSLTPDEMQTYQETLYGVQPEYVEGEEFTIPPLEEQGCQGKAMLAVYGENSAMTNNEVQERVNSSYEDMMNDPDVLDALDTWASCMREQDPSYDYESPDEVASRLWDRLSELQGYGPMSEGGDSAPAVTVAVDPVTGMPEVDEADLEELRQDELTTWRHDWDCQQEAELAQARRDAEQRVVDELLADFPELQEG
jgi:hypothetical protein